MSDNSLHFFINGVDVGKKIKTIPSVLYGVVDVFGQAEEVTITGTGFDCLRKSFLFHFGKAFIKNCILQRKRCFLVLPNFAKPCHTRKYRHLAPRLFS